MLIKFLKERFLFLPFFCISFCLGIILLNYVRVSFIFLYIITMVTLILNFIFIKKPLSIIFLYLLGFLLGGLVLLNSKIQPKNHLRNLKIPSGSCIEIKGNIYSFPKITKDHTEFIFLVKAIVNEDKVYPLTGKLLVKILKKDNFFWGEDLILEGRIYRTFYNYYKNYLKQKQIYAILKVDKYNRITHLEKKGITFLKYNIWGLREKTKQLFNQRLSSFSANILNAIILGDRTGLYFNVKDTFLKTGTVHILAISGLHIGIVGFICLLLLKILRIPRNIRYLVTIFILIFYCLLTGASSSVMRAAIMGIVILVGYLLKRETSIFNSLSIACLLILFFNPQQIFEISFQLSFLTVVAIILISPLIKSLFPKILYKNLFSRFLILSFCVSVSSFIGVTPLVIYYFKIFSPLSILANMLVVPYMGLVVASSFSLIISNFLFPVFLPYISESTDLFTIGLFKLNSLILKIPFSYFRVSKISFLFILIYYFMLLLIVLIINLIRVNHKNQPSKLI